MFRASLCPSSGEQTA